MEKTPNDKFRDARERTPSPDHPDECLSRQEAADQANAWIWEHHGKNYDLNANYIGKIEQGIIRWPDALRRAAFRALFKVPKDSELGFVNARARSRRAVVKLDDVKRRHLIETTTTLGVSGLVPRVAVLLGGGEPTPVPHRVGASDIKHIRTTTRMFESWDFTYGSALLRDAAMAQVRYSARILDESICPEQLLPELYSAVGDLANIAAFMALDSGAHQQASRVFGFALYCAEQAKDWNLRAEVLSCMTVLKISTGQPDEGLTLVELALVRPERLTATGRAMLHTGRARALAKIHQVQETLTAIGTADEHFAHAISDNDPPCLAYHNAAHQTELTGQALADLAILLGRDPREATTRLEAAAAEYTQDYVRPRALCLAKLATLTMATGDPHQAATIGHEALEIAGTIRSRRTLDDLRELSRYAAAHQHLEEVEHLRHRIATLLGTENPEKEPFPHPSLIRP